MARAHRPDVAVLDLRMPGADGVRVATSIRAELPGCRTMIVTGHGRRCQLKRTLAAGDSPLTAREAEVLEPAADGAPMAEIAERASLSQGTVRNYLSSAASELGAENRHTAVRLARERGWV